MFFRFGSKVSVKLKALGHRKIVDQAVSSTTLDIYVVSSSGVDGLTIVECRALMELEIWMGSCWIINTVAQRVLGRNRYLSWFCPVQPKAGHHRKSI